MSVKDDGGPAFPVDPVIQAPNNLGMTLRDWFAGQALAGLLAEDVSLTIGECEAMLGIPKGTYHNNTHWPKVQAHRAYRQADAMLAERSKS